MFFFFSHFFFHTSVIIIAIIRITQTLYMFCIYVERWLVWKVMDEIVSLHWRQATFGVRAECRETRKPAVFSFLINSPRPVGSNFTRRKANSKSSASETRHRAPHTLTSQVLPFLPKVRKFKVARLNWTFSLYKTKSNQIFFFGFPTRTILRKNERRNGEKFGKQW